MLMRLLPVVTVILVASPGLDGQSPRHIIDVVSLAPAAHDPALEVPESERLRVPTLLTTSPGQAHPSLPFSVRLVSLDAGAYVVGGRFIYEVVIENRGDQPVDLPRSREEALFRQDMTGARLASLHLAVDDPVLGRQLLGYTLLYGADAVPDSVITVQPGEQVSIRSQGDLWLQSLPASTPTDWVARTVNVTAELQMYDFKKEYVPQTSPESIAVEIRQRP